MKTITLYHGSLNRIKKFKDNLQCNGFYCTTSAEEANNYIVSQGDDSASEYGFMYKVEVPVSDIVETNDIDQADKCKGVLFSKEEGYYRIDLCSKYTIIEMSDEEIRTLLR